MRKPKKPRQLAECPVCGNQFKQISQNTKVCSVVCRFVMHANQGLSCECWEWSGPASKDGYGRLFVDQNYDNGKRKSIAAHRYSYEQHHDAAVPESMCVMHTCDNPKCVNPCHLELGTWADNNADRSRKGRSGSRIYSAEDKEVYSKRFGGARNPSAKLTECQAKSIKYEYPNLSGSAVAKLFGVSAATAQSIRSGKKWRFL